MSTSIKTTSIEREKTRWDSEGFSRKKQKRIKSAQHAQHAEPKDLDNSVPSLDLYLESHAIPN